MQKSVRTPVLISYFLVATMLSVILTPVMTHSSILEEPGDDRKYSSPIQAIISPTSGWTSGGEEVTITGSGFTNLAFSNITDDGVNHQWADSTADYTDQAGEWSSIAVDSNGHVHVVHINGGNYQIKHSVYDGTSWNSATINNCGHTYCWDVDLVIDDNDELHAAYTTYNTNYETLVYLHYDGTSWSDTEVSASANFGPVGIAVDSNNYPHISHAVSGQYCGDGLRLASYTGSTWTYHSVDMGSNRGCDSDIVIDENDDIYISYQVRDQSKLKVATDKGGSWNLYSADSGASTSSLYPGYMTSMAMDGQGQLHIAHFDDKNDDLRYSTGITNGPWTTTIVENSGHTGREPSIAVDLADNPHIVYHSWSGFDLKYATLSSAASSWTTSTISSADPGNGDSLFIDQNGVMHVSFYDGDSEVMNYATKSTGLSETNEIRVQFGQYGSATGTVVDDTTITVMTPSSGLTPDTIDITLWDKDDNSHTLSSTFQFIDQNDLDSDGFPNVNDDCPEVIGNSTQDVNGCPDDDGDGYSNSGDAFPSDVSEWMDTDEDGVGDNSDAFPSDPYETLDSDADGVGDNADAFPNDGTESADSDGDGVGDNGDAFPNDANESMDSDGDGVGDNSDSFPVNAMEQFDADGDGVGDNSDAFPDDANESVDSDGDGVGDNSDAFPDDANESVDSDGDGIGDNSDEYPFIDNSVDADSDGYLDLTDSFPNDATQWMDSDGDGYGDNISGNNPDLFTNASSQWADADGDGYGDNWGNSSWNTSRLFVWPGQFIENAELADHCPTISGNSTADGFFGCPDGDGDGIADQYDDVNDSAEIVEKPEQETQIESNSEDESYLQSLFSGDSETVTQTVGFGAILLALLALLQTNVVAALLPDAFRWVQVLRHSSKLSREEIKELNYLQSLVQAYYQDIASLNEELELLKADLTARYMNNEVKKGTREKILTLVGELQTSTPDQVERIAFNDSYFGLIGTTDSEVRTELLEQELAMRVESPVVAVETPQRGVQGSTSPEDGYEYLEMPSGSGNWFVRNIETGEWEKWS